ncbi:hypothetical protein UA08_08786 [Talaromyces atroroseus]|uniref:Uncharacterized protein n=1 Tax=Talaromyces atroroseus TaxID=1441469 RepID=A0A225AKN1_TALAT|nr:hypothetical protein UA08_08786 [Talaromyces atroroseus]OKL56089.1 hypothetical protein UA08_08786 [Talaromyces atroroseus]
MTSSIGPTEGSVQASRKGNVKLSWSVDAPRFDLSKCVGSVQSRPIGWQNTVAPRATGFGMPFGAVNSAKFAATEGALIMVWWDASHQG